MDFCILQATSKVNTKVSMFSGLVSLEIPVEDLYNQVEQTKTNRVSTKYNRPKSQVTIINGNRQSIICEKLVECIYGI